MAWSMPTAVTSTRLQVRALLPLGLCARVRVGGGVGRALGALDWAEGSERRGGMCAAWSHARARSPAAGVFATNPREAPGTVTWRQAIDLGETSLAPAEVYAIVQQMGVEYRGNAYHLLQMNCNTFSDDFARRLTGHGAPPWVNRLANFAVTLHCLLPQGWVPPLKTPGAVPDALFDVDDHDAAQRSSTGESARLLASRPGSRSDAPQLAAIQRAPSGASMAAPYSSAAQLVM